MDVNMACRILGLDADANPTKRDVGVAKRRLLKAFQPDKHPAEQREIFARMTRDVIEASEHMSNISGQNKATRSPRESSDVILERVLYCEELEYWENRTYTTNPTSLVRYKKRHASDNALAVVVLGTDYDVHWQTRPDELYGGNEAPKSHFGSRLYLLVVNRAQFPVSGLYIGNLSYLVDDRGHQYSPSVPWFYRSLEEYESYVTHSDFLAPEAKVDGFILFPKLRRGSTSFVRWCLRGSYDVGGERRETVFDVRLT